jgi:ATP/maltotriose-dependent transcriptional regulator MalT
VLFLGPKPAEEAAARCRRLLGEIAGQQALEVHVLGALSYLVAIQGRRDEAKELAESADQLMWALGEGWHFPAFAGLEALWQHDPGEAERKLRRGYDALKRVGERSHFCTLASLLARVAYARGDYEEAHTLTIEAEEAAAANDVHCHIHWRGTRAKVLARQGRLEDGEKLGREAAAFAATSDFLSSHGDALVDLAEVLILASRPLEAAEALRESIALYGRKENALAAGVARERLAALEVQALS